MEIDTPGGVMRGYCASGNDISARPPISVMTTDSTVAKIGRSMKKFEIMAPTPHLLPGFIRRRLFLLGRIGGRRVAVRRPGERRHRRPIRPYLHARADLWKPSDDDPVVRFQPLRDHAQAVRLERPRGDPAILHFVVGIENVDVLQALIGTDGPV